ncbi:MAG: FeoB small GTPase domain-containing protein [bacterium]|jgi:ferrous iron transport protein B
MKLLLAGNPNVGKSAIFAKLAGVSVVTSNYPGTTVTYTKGYLTHGGEKHEVIDVPGTYQLTPDCEAERVAVRMLEEGDVIINVVDATNLERNLNLTLQLLEMGKPMVVALNIWDDAKHKGIAIDIEKLSKMLQVPVVATNGITGEGLKKLQQLSLTAGAPQWKKCTREERWETIGRIITAAQNLRDRRHTLAETLQDASTHPVLGLPLAVGVLFGAFQIIVNCGERLLAGSEMLFSRFYAPFIYKLQELLGGNGFLSSLLLGEISGATIDFEGAMGVLTSGVFLVFGLVLPYITMFYLIFGFLEDLGYLPRLAVLLDRFMHKIGLHGYSIIPMVLACGCNVPGLMAVRNLETRRERFITAVITAVTIPCMAQSAMILRAVGSRGGLYLGLIILTLLTVGVALGTGLNGLVSGTTPSLLMEIPPYRLPSLTVQMKKLRLRIACFLREAVPYVLGGVLLINYLAISGGIAALGRFFAPVITGAFGLPEGTVSALVIGVLRKDAAVAMLEPLGLSNAQTVTAITVLILYFPCVATFTVLLKELGGLDTLKAVAVMAATTLATGSALRLLLAIFRDPVWIVIIELIILSGLIGWRTRRRRKSRGEDIFGTDENLNV